jgi:hypothetical protein
MDVIGGIGDFGDFPGQSMDSMGNSKSGISIENSRRIEKLYRKQFVLVERFLIEKCIDFLRKLNSILENLVIFVLIHRETLITVNTVEPTRKIRCLRGCIRNPISGKRLV